MRYFGIVAVIGLAVAAEASAQTPLAQLGQPGWSRTDEGCFLWNAKPGTNETVSWSGACENGRADGPGTKAWRSGGKPGSRYEGTMRDGKEDGRGTLTYPNGDHFDGEWHDGKPNGLGQFTTSSGVVVDGFWKDGCLDEGVKRAWVAVDPASCGEGFRSSRP